MRIRTSLAEGRILTFVSSFDIARCRLYVVFVGLRTLGIPGPFFVTSGHISSRLNLEMIIKVDIEITLGASEEGRGRDRAW